MIASGSRLQCENYFNKGESQRGETDQDDGIDQKTRYYGVLCEN